MDDHLFDLLSKLSKRDLILFAESKQLKVPEDSTKEQVISILQDAFPAELQDLLRNAVRLELKSTESNLLNVIGKEIKDLKSNNNELREKLIGVDFIKYLFGAIGTILALMIGVGSYFGYRQISTTEENITKLKQELVTSQEINNGLKTAFLIYRDYSTNQQIEAVKSFMENFSHDLPDKNDYIKIIKNKDDLCNLIKTSRDLYKNDESTGYQSLRFICIFLDDLNIIKGLKNIKDQEDLKEQLFINYNKIIQSKEKNTHEIPENYNIFESYYENILGVLSYNLYKVKRHELDLINAKKHFYNATNNNPSYGRVYNNLAAVIYAEYLSTSDIKRKENIIREGKELMNLSDKCPQTPFSKSTTYNNIAAFSLLEAHFYELKDLSRTKLSLEFANENVIKAIKTSDINPGAYVSMAEIESYSMHVNGSAEKMTEIEKAQKVDEICEYLRLSVVNGYNFPGSINKDNFFDNFEDLKYVKKLGPNYEERIFKAVDLSN